MNAFYNLYVRLMIWLGAAPPEGYKDLLPSPTVASEIKEPVSKLADEGGISLEKISKKHSHTPSPLSTCAIIGGGWAISLGSGITIGIIISLVLGFGLGLLLSIFAGLGAIANPYSVPNQYHPILRPIIQLMFTLLSVFMSTIIIGIFYTLCALPIGLPIGIVLGILGGFGNTAYQVLKYEDKTTKTDDNCD